MIAASALFVLATVGASQEQRPGLNPLNVPPAISGILATFNTPVTRELGHFLAPQGSRLDPQLIPSDEKQNAFNVIGRVFKPDRTPSFASLNWTAISNDGKFNEQLITKWPRGQTQVTWSDVDSSAAVLSVTFLNILLPVDEPDDFVIVVSEWILDNFQMPDPLPSQMELFRTRMIEGNDAAIIGSIAFPDDVNRELSSSLPAKKRWCQSFSFAASKTTLVLLVHINWITTESPYRPPSKYRDGKRVSRFDRGG